MEGNQNMSWQRISSFILCLLLLSATACGEGPDDNTNGKTSNMTPAAPDDRRPFDGLVDIDHDVDIATALRESDVYELKIDGDDAPVIENDTLTLTISYGGGCKKHYFTLVRDGSFMGSDPVRLVVALTHDDNGDTCEAYPTGHYVFDLTPIKTLYWEDGGTDEAITLRLWHLGHPSGSVDAGFLDLVYTFAP